MTREKISGIKVHIGLDTKGLPHAIRITTTEVTDRDGVIETFGWLEKIRRLWKNCEHKIHTTL
jgi:hypothetical protein